MPAEDDVTVLDSMEIFVKNGFPVSLFFTSSVDETFSVVAVSSSISSVVTFDEESQM